MGASNWDNLFFLADVASENRVVCLRFPLLPELPVSTVCSRIKNLFAWSIREVNSMWPFTSPSPKIGLKAGRLTTCQAINDSGLATLLGEGERCWSWHNFLSCQWEIANFIFQNKRFSFISLKQLPTLSLMLLFLCIFGIYRCSFVAEFSTFSHTLMSSNEDPEKIKLFAWAMAENHIVYLLALILRKDLGSGRIIPKGEVEK